MVGKSKGPLFYYTGVEGLDPVLMRFRIEMIDSHSARPTSLGFSRAMLRFF